MAAWNILKEIFHVCLLIDDAVSSDLVRYMSSTFNADGGTFLTKDPNWATDFAPDGSSQKVFSLLKRVKEKMLINM